jgi:hypothetical protein
MTTTTKPFSSYESLSVYSLVKSGIVAFFSKEKPNSSLSAEELYLWETGYAEMDEAYVCGINDAQMENEMYWSLSHSCDESIQAFLIVAYLQGYHA